jgi:RHS repeat-associated protein
LFTGRRVDILDNGSLKIQYNRNRYYDYYTGRWLTHDPLGISPNGQMPNAFGIITQYSDSRNLYEYVACHPTVYMDPSGLGITVLEPESFGHIDIARVISYLENHGTTGLISSASYNPKYTGNVADTTILEIPLCGIIICPDCGPLFLAIRVWHWEPDFTLRIIYPDIFVNATLLEEYPGLAEAAARTETRMLHHEYMHVAILESVYTPFDTVGAGVDCSESEAVAEADSVAEWLFDIIFAIKTAQANILHAQWDAQDYVQDDIDIAGYIEAAGYPLNF